MKFQIEGKQTKTLVYVEPISGEIEITKAEVQRVTGCPSVVDGDSTGWYDYVGDAIEAGAEFKVVDLTVDVPDEIKLDGPATMLIHSVEWT